MKNHLLFTALLALTIAGAIITPPRIEADTLYVSTIGDNKAIVKVDSDGAATVLPDTLKAFANTHLGPDGIALDSGGNIFVADKGNIIKITPEGVISTFATGKFQDYYLGLAFDGAGNLYAANWGLGTIEKFEVNGKRSTFANRRTAYLACDHAGNLYGTGALAIDKYTPKGVYSPFFTKAEKGYLGGMAFDSHDNLYVVRLGKERKIEKLDVQGGHSIFVETGLRDASSLAFDSADNLYVTAGGAILKVTPDGKVATFAQLSSERTTALPNKLPPAYGRFIAVKAEAGQKP